MSVLSRILVLLVVTALAALLVWITPTFWQPMAAFVAVVLVVAVLLLMVTNDHYDTARCPKLRDYS